MSELRSAALALATWAHEFLPTSEDLSLADRSLRDTVAVSLAARGHPLLARSASLGEGARWAVAGHVVDFDDLHMESTTHVSAVCVPVALHLGGDARSYLAGAGVMARIGSALGWNHYSAGWHATCTAGAPAAAAAAGVALGLEPEGIAHAISLAIPGAGGVQRAFGTDAKSLQVGFAVDAGLRAARLASAGAQGDLGTLDEWIRLVGGVPGRIDLSGSAVPGGLAIKIYPCCYALQRPISAIASLFKEKPDPATVTRILLRTPEATVAPLIHSRPVTGLQAKFSLEYAAATALLDEYSGLDCFTDDAVARDQARRYVERVEVELTPGGTSLLDGELEVEVHRVDGTVNRTRLQLPPGSPDRPPTDVELSLKLEDCVRGTQARPDSWTWANSADVLRSIL